MKKLLASLLIALMTVFAVQAQEDSQIVYYMAADENGVQQVYQQILGEEGRQLTHAENDVVNFGAAYDGLSIAYVSDGQLWLQPIHTEEAEALAEISATQIFSSPVYSQDGQYIAYADQGIWLLDLATRETTQILEDVPLEDMAANAREYRTFMPQKFILDETGKATKLILDIGVWEWKTVGVIDLESGELQELEGQVHTNLLPLSDGRVLVYGNAGVAGDFALHMADSIEDINTYREVLKFGDITSATLFAEQAVEIEPGLVRVYGPAVDVDMPFSTVFAFDFNTETLEADEVNFVDLGESDNTIPGRLSPDGTMAAAYLNTLWTDMGTIYGDFRLVDLMTGEAIDAQFPDVVSIFHWQQ